LATRSKNVAARRYGVKTLRRSKNVVKSLRAVRQLLRRGIKKIIREAVYLSVWATLSKSVDNRCGGAKSCLSGNHAWLSVNQSSNQTRRPTSW
jgi:hypothetical protein